MEFTQTDRLDGGGGFGSFWIGGELIENSEIRSGKDR